MDVPFYIPASIQGSPISASLPTPIVFLFLIIAILTDLRQHYIVALVFISLVIHDVEGLFIYLLVICVSSLEKCLLMSLFIFNRVVWLLLL
jgi:hypothetical protein